MVRRAICAFGLMLVVMAAAITTVRADPATAAHLRDAALADPTAYAILESLTTEIGPRMVASPAAARARDWGVAKLKALGFTNVHVESFAKEAWARDADSAEVVAPFPQKLALLALGHSPATPKEGITAQIVVIRSMNELLSAPIDAFKGKIVVVNQPMTRTQGGTGYGVAVAARYAPSEAARRGALAYLVRSISTSTSRAPHAGSTIYDPKVPQIPAAALGVPDADLLDHMAARGPVTIHITLLSHQVNGQGFTVSGDIAGSDKPNEVIVIGGHLDSWDPGTGAIDDGAGIAITTAAAHLIGQLPRHPARTIRVVMWGSEEQGGSGAAYLAAHEDELANFVVAGESDIGADNIISLSLPAGAWDLAEIKPLQSVLAPLKVMAAPDPALEAGSDVDDIQGAGVPVLALNQDASRYFDYHHSADDTLAIVDEAQLRQNVAAWAATLDILADSSADFRRLKK